MTAIQLSNRRTANFLKTTIPLELILIGLLLTQDPETVVIDKQIFTVLLYVAGLFVFIIGFVTLRALNKQENDGKQIINMRIQQEHLKGEIEALKAHIARK